MRGSYVFQNYTEVKLNFGYQPNDKEVVWGWNGDNPTPWDKRLCFYDAVNKCIFKSEGTRNGFIFEHYAPYQGVQDQWLLDFKEKLED